MDTKPRQDIKITTATDEDISQDKPLSFGNYLSLPITEEQRDLYTGHILKRIDEIIETPERKDMMDLAESWRNQYYGKVAETSFPWSGAFNLDMRLTPKIQDAVVAQTEEAFDDVDPRWSVGPVTNRNMMTIRDKQERILDAFEDQEMNNIEDLEAIRHDAFLLGLGWEAMVFERKLQRVRDFKIYRRLDEFMRDFPDDYQKYPQYIRQLGQGQEVRIIIEYNQEIRRSPKRKHVKFEDAIVPVNAKGVEGVNNADVVARRIWLKWHEIKTLEEEGDYISGVSERLRFKSDLTKDGRLQDDPDYLTKPYETFEVQYYIYLTLNGKKRRIKCLFNIEKEHKACLRGIRYPYDHNRCYLIPHCIKYTNEGLFQDGMGRMLQDIHIAGNATINHVLNASSLANSLSIKAREGSAAARRIMEHRWYPGSVIELQNMDDAQQFNFSTPNLASLISLFGIIEKFGQDVSGIINYQLGAESTEDPEAPASKTIALMRKAEIKLRRYIKNLKRSEDEAGYQALRLIYQFVPTERLSAILGEDVDETKGFLQPILRIITNSSGFAIERIFEERKDMLMGRMLLQDPLVAQDPERRVKVYYTIAKSVGSNWDKKIVGIIPTPEEIAQQKAQAQQQEQAKKLEAMRGATTQALEGGATPEEAAGVGRQAGKSVDILRERQTAMQQEEQRPQPRRR